MAQIGDAAKSARVCIGFSPEVEIETKRAFAVSLHWDDCGLPEGAEITYGRFFTQMPPADERSLCAEPVVGLWNQLLGLCRWKLGGVSVEGRGLQGGKRGLTQFLLLVVHGVDRGAKGLEHLSVIILKL